MKLEYLIVSLISNLITSIGLIYSFSKLSSTQIKYNIKNIVIIILLIILTSINNYYNLITFKIICAFFLIFITNLLIFKINIKTTFIIVVILSVLSILLEFVLSPIAAIFITDVDSLNSNAFIKLIFSILNTIVLILVINYHKILKLINSCIELIQNFTNFYTTSIIFICGLNIMMFMFGYNLRNIRLLIVVIICTLLILICLKTIINDKFNNKLLMEKNKNLKDEHKAYAKTIDDCRELKHNLKNELYSIKSKLSKEDQNIINSIITKYNKNYEWINTLNDIPEGLQGLLYLKIQEAKTKNIKINLNIKSSLKTVENDYLDLSTSLGILIDNAIEASKKAKSKIMLINITEEKNIIFIEILNKFINNIDTNKIGKKNYSTKEYKSGLGLDFINKMDKSKIKVSFKIINNLFITTLIYKNKKIKPQK